MGLFCTRRPWAASSGRFFQGSYLKSGADLLEILEKGIYRGDVSGKASCHSIHNNSCRYSTSGVVSRNRPFPFRHSWDGKNYSIHVGVISPKVGGLLQVNSITWTSSISVSSILSRQSFCRLFLLLSFPFSSAVVRFQARFPPTIRSIDQSLPPLASRGFPGSVGAFRPPLLLLFDRIFPTQRECCWEYKKVDSRV